VRVLFLTLAYPTEEEPAAGIFVREHARAAARFVDVAIVHLDRSAGARGLSCRRIPDEGFPAWRVTYAAKPRAVSAALHVAASMRGLREARRAGFDPDLVHAHFFPAASVAILWRMPLVVTEQWSVFLPEDPARLPAALGVAARAVFSRACVVLPVSEALRRGIERVGGRSPQRIVRNVVDTQLFRPGPKPANSPPLLLSVGLLYEAKGFDLLLAALPQLERPVRVEIVGDGPLRATLEAQSEQLGLRDVVSFVGRLAKDEVAERMRAADVYVLPSRFETSAAAALEALACGTPVVGTNVGAIPELVDADSGVLVEAGSPPALAAGLKQALDTPFDRAEIARRAAARYAPEVVGRQLADVYEACRAGIT
jgi:glycosyltransferase involved in cell wall biosynthesis